MRNFDDIIEKINKVVESHYIGNGAYARFLWDGPAETGKRKLGINEYGCADAMNILYSIGKFPTGKKRQQCLDALLSLQNPETGLFVEETHPPFTQLHTVPLQLSSLMQPPSTTPRHSDSISQRTALRGLLTGLSGLQTPGLNHIRAQVYTL